MSRLKDWSDQESWRVFFERIGSLFYNAASSGLPISPKLDVVQETSFP